MLEAPTGLQIELGKLFTNPVKESIDYTNNYKGKHIPKNSLSSMIAKNL